MNNRSGLAHFSALGAWAVAFGCAVGWDVLSLPLTGFLPKAGPAGTVLGLAVAALAMVVIAWNFHYMMVKCPGPGGVYSYAKKAFGHDHGYICGWFLSSSAICSGEIRFISDSSTMSPGSGSALAT